MDVVVELSWMLWWSCHRCCGGAVMDVMLELSWMLWWSCNGCCGGAVMDVVDLRWM